MKHVITFRGFLNGSYILEGASFVEGSSLRKNLAVVLGGWPSKMYVGGADWNLPQQTLHLVLWPNVVRYGGPGALKIPWGHAEGQGFI